MPELAARRDTTMLGRISGAMRCLSFLLVTAAPVYALAQEERPVPPLPIPDVASPATSITDVAPTGTHRRARLAKPLPRPRTAPISTSTAPALSEPKTNPTNVIDAMRL